MKKEIEAANRLGNISGNKEACLLWLQTSYPPGRINFLNHTHWHLDRDPAPMVRYLDMLAEKLAYVR